MLPNPETTLTVTPFVDNDDFSLFFGRFLYKEYTHVSVILKKMRVFTGIADDPFHDFLNCDGILFHETYPYHYNQVTTKRIYEFLLTPLNYVALYDHYQSKPDKLTVEEMKKVVDFYNKLLTMIEDKIELSIEDFTNNQFTFIDDATAKTWFDSFHTHMENDRPSSIIQPKMTYYEKENIIKKWMSKLFNKEYL
jgi:hypothetical protein